MKHRYINNVATLTLDSAKCTGCTMCMLVCPHQVFALENRKIVINDLNSCMECGACVKNCAFQALGVHPGVGCASAIIKGWLTGTEPSCDCTGSSGSCC